MVQSLLTTNDSGLPIATAAGLMGISRSSVYYTPAPPSEEELECKRIIDMHGESLRLLDTVEGAAFRFTVAHAEKPEDGQAEQPADEQAEESENGQTEQPAEDLQSERLDGDEADQA